MGWFNTPWGQPRILARDPPLSDVCAICLVDNLHNNGHASARKQINTVAVRNRGLPALQRGVIYKSYTQRFARGSESFLSCCSNAHDLRGLERRKSWRAIRVIGNYRPRFSRAVPRTIEKTTSGWISVLASIFNRG